MAAGADTAAATLPGDAVSQPRVDACHNIALSGSLRKYYDDISG